MKTSLLVCVLAATLLLAAPLPVASAEAEKHGETITVKGEILDMACFVGHGAKGPDHAACAKRCVKGGQPMGLLADDGKVFLLYASHENSAAFDQAKEFAGSKVEVTGKPASQGGINGIEVHGVKAP